MEQTDLTQRLRALATRLLDAYEAIELPTSFVEADRAAKALISIGKAIALAGDEPSASKPPAPPAAAPRRPAGVSPYLEVERQARALMQADRVLRGGELSDEQIDALLGPP
ncbi:hypothetical protein [Asticcacaulis sp.]|uniref:hypothetical protein n=1 Tax=Asticcacaulis sp. TaxID=1872648 RepID=UPI002C88AB2E|nr:hypothetical protein [Asticcacaulis sp.]HTM82449.1 hypothetical protein [Asticcacaulis sp.]